MRELDFSYGDLNPLPDATLSSISRSRTDPIQEVNQFLTGLYTKNYLKNVDEFYGVVVHQLQRTNPSADYPSSQIISDGDENKAAAPYLAYKVYIPELECRPFPESYDDPVIATYRDIYASLGLIMAIGPGSIVIVKFGDFANMSKPLIIGAEGAIDGGLMPAVRSDLRGTFGAGNSVAIGGGDAASGDPAYVFGSPVPQGFAYPGSVFKPSRNWSKRKKTIQHVALHTTEGNLKNSFAILRGDESYNKRRQKQGKKQRRVSAHYIVAKDGVIYNLVPDADTSWHGSAYNHKSIGIEIVGVSAEPATWNEQNVLAIAELLLWLSLTYDIPLVYEGPGKSPSLPKSFIAHGAIDPSRRVDPGPHFPWEKILALTKSPAVVAKIAKMEKDPTTFVATTTPSAPPETSNKEATGHESKVTS